MKLHRFAALFFALVLTLTCCVVPAHAVEDIDIEATAALLLDGESEAVLYEKDAHARRYPASITKVMTALLVIEAIDRGELRLEQNITATASAVSGLPADASTAGIQPGEVLTVEQLLYCLMVSSANEVGNIFAEELCGTVTAFVAKMNERAAELGCEDTHFVNTSGLPDDNHYTTAWDIWLFTRAAMEHDLFMTVCNTKSYYIPATNMSGERTLHSTNLLISNWRALGYLYDGAQDRHHRCRRLLSRLLRRPGRPPPHLRNAGLRGYARPHQRRQGGHELHRDGPPLRLGLCQLLLPYRPHR